MTTFSYGIDPNAVEALRERYDAGDKAAVLEAIALFRSVSLYMFDKPPDETYRCLNENLELNDSLQPISVDSFREWYPQYPLWLEIAVREALFSCVHYGEDSLRRAFQIPVESGCSTTIERTQAISRENKALGFRLGVQAAHKDTRLPYPPGETADTLVGNLIGGSSGPVSEATIKRWCRRARARRACEIHGKRIDHDARTIYRWILVTDSYPPWKRLRDGEIWDMAIKRGLHYRITKRRFW